MVRGLVVCCSTERQLSQTIDDACVDLFVFNVGYFADRLPPFVFFLMIAMMPIALRVDICSRAIHILCPRHMHIYVHTVLFRPSEGHKRGSSAHKEKYIDLN